MYTRKINLPRRNSLKCLARVVRYWEKTKKLMNVYDSLMMIKSNFDIFYSYLHIFT